MRVRTDAQGSVTLVLPDLPEAVFDVSVSRCCEEDGCTAEADVQLTRVDPLLDTLTQVPGATPDMWSEVQAGIEKVAASLGKDPGAVRDAIELDWLHALASLNEIQEKLLSGDGPAGFRAKLQKAAVAEGSADSRFGKHPAGTARAADVTAAVPRSGTPRMRLVR